jgi:L-2-aminoadipate reductase
LLAILETEVKTNLTIVTNTDDFIWRLVKGCIQLGQAPRISNVVNMCPVDYVADCVVEVAANPKSVDLGVFHTWNPHGFKFDDLFAGIISKFGVTPIEYIHWRTSLMELTLSTSDHALFPLLHFVLDDLPTSTKSPELDDQNTREILKNSGVACPKMDRLLPMYLGYLVYVDFLPQGSTTPEANLPILKQWGSWGGLVRMVARSGQ